MPLPSRGTAHPPGVPRHATSLPFYHPGSRVWGVGRTPARALPAARPEVHGAGGVPCCTTSLPYCHPASRVLGVLGAHPRLRFRLHAQKVMELVGARHMRFRPSCRPGFRVWQAPAARLRMRICLHAQKLLKLVVAGSHMLPSTLSWKPQPHWAQLKVSADAPLSGLCCGSSVGQS